MLYGVKPRLRNTNCRSRKRFLKIPKRLRFTHLIGNGQEHPQTLMSLFLKYS